ncbi:MAG: UDP-glucose 4-epimerase GalE [Rhodospirillaceae bacterium]|nr:UDP-glucose 4-epimerase GalE [Rhodospirillaceae bacterium]
MTLSKSPSTLVTGGAGYIGSHTVLALLNHGLEAVVIDDLSTGVRALVSDGVPFIQGNAGDIALVRDVIREHGCTSAIHFAGSIVNPESFEKPLEYYANNVSVSRNLLEACIAEDVTSFIFSSSASVYGDPYTVPVPETAPTLPVSPYGETKLITEWMVRNTAAATDMRYAALRYFNVAGADAKMRSGQAGPVATHLIKIAAEAAVGLRPGVTIFGDDFDTPDGTCIRDYIHVSDIAEAHVNALNHLRNGGESLTLNLGYGNGYSVREVLDMFNRITPTPITIETGPRRIGDVDKLIADPGHVGQVLGWKPRNGDLRIIVESAIAWEQKLATEKADADKLKELAE